MSCPDCFKGFSLNGQAVGTITPNGDYFTPAPSGSSSRAIFLLSDIFGLALNNPKVMADHFAKELDCDVWVPDLFAGSPPVKFEDMRIPEHAGEKLSLGMMINLGSTLVTHGAAFYRNRPSVVDPRVVEFHTRVQAEKHYEAISAVGYCFGGAMAIRLGSTDMFKSVAIFHPASHSFDQVSAMKVPSSWGCAEKDFEFAHEKRLKEEVILKEKMKQDPSLQCEFFDYKGTTHGYAARPNLNYPDVKLGFEQSLLQTISWFQKTLFS